MVFALQIYKQKFDVHLLSPLRFPFIVILHSSINCIGAQQYIIFLAHSVTGCEARAHNCEKRPLASLYQSVLPFVCVEQLGSHGTDFNDI